MVTEKRKQAYNSWCQMKQRCFNPNCISYPNYGGRGIKICERWLKFENFYQDMGDRPEDKSLDRIDNDGNYEPNNCKWSTRKEQVNNRRPDKKHKARSNSLTLTLNGTTKSISEWSKETNLSYQVLLKRYKKGWTAEQVLTTRLKF